MKIEVNGIDVNYRTQGEGQTLVLLHGWGADIRCFDRIFRDLAADRRVIALDLPGFGLSGDPAGEWGVGDYAEFVKAFLAELHVDRMLLLGHSFGGRISIKLATDPEFAPRIEKLVLTGSAGLKRKRSFWGKVRGAIRRGLRGILKASGMSKVFPALYDKLGRRFASRDYLAATPLLRECLKKVVAEDLAPLLPKIAAPTLLIWGRNDTETPVADGCTMRSLIPGARLEVLDDAGHFAFLNKPAKFGTLLKEFLR